jgi:hypothetical protein
MAIEIVSFPMKNGGSFHSYVKLPEGKLVYQFERFGRWRLNPGEDEECGDFFHLPKSHRS